MDKYDINSYIKPSERFKALGHPVRLWIASQLVNGERCVHEFVDKTDLDFSTISQHISAMKGAGILTAEKRGKEVYYRLDCPCVRDFLKCLGDHRERCRKLSPRTSAMKNKKPTKE